MKSNSKLVLVILGVSIFLVAIRAILPWIALKSINWALENKMESYSGRLEDLDLSLYRGAYQLQGLVIQKKNSKLEPILKIREADLSLAWRELFLGRILADIVVDEMEVSLLDGSSGENKQLGNDERNWREIFAVLVPISIESLRIKNSSLSFNNSDLGEAVPVKIEKIDFYAKDLRSQAGKNSDSLSSFSLKAQLQQHAELKATGKADVLAKSPRGDINIELLKFRPETMNALLLHYVPLDITKGSLSLFGEGAIKSGEVVGYANLFLKDIDVIAPRQNLVSWKHFGMELLGAFSNWFLKNNKNKSVAVHIPFERRGGKFNVDGSEAFWSAIKNRNEEMKPGFSEAISLKNLEGKSESIHGG